jgi:hypothetical protein
VAFYGAWRDGELSFERQFTWALARLAVSHLLRQDESYGQRAGAATHFYARFRLILNSESANETRMHISFLLFFKAGYLDKALWLFALHPAWLEPATL